MKLIAIYKRPEDPEAFDQAYFNTHIPLLKKVPGLQKTTITRIKRSLIGDDVYIIAEMSFSDEASYKAAMKSPEMAAASENLNGFASGLVTLVVGTEQDRPTTSS